jgi:hypothetical protein
MKFTQQDLIAATPVAPSVGVINFSQARCRLSAAFSDAGKEIETERKTRKENIYLDLSLSIREAVQAAEADLRQLGLIHSLSVECSDDALEVVELFRPSFSSGRPEIRVN